MNAERTAYNIAGYISHIAGCLALGWALDLGTWRTVAAWMGTALIANAAVFWWEAKR